MVFVTIYTPWPTSKGLDHSYLPIYACLLCFMLILASLFLVVHVKCITLHHSHIRAGKTLTPVMEITDKKVGRKEALVVVWRGEAEEIWLTLQKVPGYRDAADLKCAPLCWNLLHGVRLFAIPWTVACWTPLSVELSRQEYWSGLPFPSTMLFSTDTKSTITIIMC